MVFALAAIMLHVVPAVPAATATVPPAVIGTIQNLPDAPIPANATPAAGHSEKAPAQAPMLNATAVDPKGADTRPLSAIRITDIGPSSKPLVMPVERMPSRKTWLMLAVAAHGAATFDAYTTRQAIAAGGHEANPMLRPFSGSPAIYAAVQVCPFVMDYAAIHMQHSQNSFLRHSWWVPQAVSAGVSVFSGVHNLHVAH